MLTPVSLDQEPTAGQLPTNGLDVSPKDSETATRYSYPLAVKLAVRNDYVHGQGILRIVADKHGVSFAAAQRWRKLDKWSVLRENWLKRQNAKTEEPEVITPQQPSEVSSSTSVADSIARVNGHIAKIDRAINEADSGRELRDLMMARKLAVDQWGYLTGYAKPGTRRQSRKGSSGGSPRHSDFVPLDDQEGGGG